MIDMFLWVIFVIAIIAFILRISKSETKQMPTSFKRKKPIKYKKRFDWNDDWD